MLVLLPGMDGTGKLFEGFLRDLDFKNPMVISLPSTGCQDYDSLLKYVQQLLPTEDYYLVAESFSGAIAAKLSLTASPHLMGVIFVGAFLTPPRKLLLTMARFLPIKALLNAPISDVFVRFFMLGLDAEDTLVKQFKTVVKSVPLNTLRMRMKVMSKLKPSKSKSTLPAFYLSGEKDLLVGKDKLKYFENYYANFKIISIDGPHFMLQAKPGQCAEVIKSILNS